MYKSHNLSAIPEKAVSKIFSEYEFHFWAHVCPFNSSLADQLSLLKQYKGWEYIGYWNFQILGLPLF